MYFIAASFSRWSRRRRMRSGEIDSSAVVKRKPRSANAALCSGDGACTPATISWRFAVSTTASRGELLVATEPDVIREAADPVVATRQSDVVCHLLGMADDRQPARRRSGELSLGHRSSPRSGSPDVYTMSVSSRVSTNATHDSPAAAKARPRPAPRATRGRGAPLRGLTNTSPRPPTGASRPRQGVRRTRGTADPSVPPCPRAGSIRPDPRCPAGPDRSADR